MSLKYQAWQGVPLKLHSVVGIVTGCHNGAKNDHLLFLFKTIAHCKSSEFKLVKSTALQRYKNGNAIALFIGYNLHLSDFSRYTLNRYETLHFFRMKSDNFKALQKRA
jgi:hypothetical protein